MPKTKFQEVIFTIIMVFFMVYAMICYNTALNIGEMKNEVFLSAFKELSFMCPLMSLAATLIFKNAGVEIISVWLETTALNFPIALCWQLFFAGPIVIFIFRHIFRRSLTADNTH